MEEKKICNCCKIEKSINDFAKKYKTKDDVQKYSSICKSCFNIRDTERRKDINYKHEKSEYDKIYYEQNKEKILKNKKEYHLQNKDEILKKKKEYRKIPKNKERANEYFKNYVKQNREKYYEYRRKNPHIIAWRNILYRTLRYLGTEKEGSTQSMLGYSAIQLKYKIENQFKEGMTWENYGEWEIDHIIPLTSFNKITDTCIVNSLDNLQPLWKKENIAKYNHII